MTISELSAEIYGEVNSILAKNRIDTEIGLKLTTEELNALFSSLYEQKKIRFKPQVEFDKTETGMRLRLLDSEGKKIDAIDKIISISAYLNEY